MLLFRWLYVVSIDLCERNSYRCVAWSIFPGNFVDLDFLLVCSCCSVIRMPTIAQNVLNAFFEAYIGLLLSLSILFFFLVMSPLFRVAIWMCLCIFVGCTICIRPNHTKWQWPNTHKHNAVAHFPPLKFNICIIQHIFHIFQLSYLLYN